MHDDDNATTNIAKRMLFAHKIHIYPPERVAYRFFVYTKTITQKAIHTKTNYTKNSPMDFSTDFSDWKIIWKKRPCNSLWVLIVVYIWTKLLLIPKLNFYRLQSSLLNVCIDFNCATYLFAECKMGKTTRLWIFYSLFIGFVRALIDIDQCVLIPKNMAY